MTTKRKNLFLYLTLVCFLGLILIFIFDGYMGVYDTVFVTSGEYEQEIEADSWMRQDRYWPSVGVERDSRVLFRYEVDNRRFSGYTADVEVSLWHSQEKVVDLIIQPMSAGSFDEAQLNWIIETADFVPTDIPPEQSYEFTVVIKRGEIERRVIIYINPAPYVSKAVIPVPEPVR